MNLKGKVALVTGAGRGIGKAIALKLAKCGADVVVNYNGSADKAAQVVEEIKELGVKTIAYKANIADFEETQTMMKDIVAQFGRIDILVNNAGITKDNLILRMKESEFDDVININLKGTFNCLKHVSKIMLKQKYGRIVNISSISGVNGTVGQVNYSASKAGVVGMTKTLAKELGSKGITVNAIAPGFICTEMTEVLKDDYKEKILEGIPVKRLGQTEDIANAVAFLVSDEASYITGQTIMVDGGLGL